MDQKEVTEIASAVALAVAPVLAEAIGVVIKETLGSDPYREERRRHKELFLEQEKARTETPPIHKVVEAGSGGGDVLVNVRLRSGYSHRVGGSPDNVVRGPRTLLMPFREAWGSSAMFPLKANCGRFESFKGRGKDGDAIYGPEALAATARALAHKRDLAELDYKNEKRRDEPAELRCTLAPTKELRRSEREIPESAAW